jgi:hypothetical protein
LRIEPPVDALVTIDGRRALGTPPRVELAKSSVPAAITVQAAGFADVQLNATPDRDQLLVVTLTRASGTGSPSATASAQAEPASVASSAASKSTTVRQAQPLPRTKKPALITEYPFKH